VQRVSAFRIRRRSGTVVRMRASVRTTRSADPTVYPVEEKVGEHPAALDRRVAPLLERWLARRGVDAFVGADQFIYWKQYDPHKRVAPSFGLEVVSRHWEKDYAEAPGQYDAAGAGELVIFDPAWAEHRDGVRWQVYRRLGKRGLVRVEARA
jgi:hypothetical protein